MDELNILVTGALSGIGKEFVRAYLKNPWNCILAIDRDFPHHAVSPAPSLNGQPGEEATTRCTSIATYRADVGDVEPSRVVVVRADISNESDLRNLQGLENLGIVIHSAGVRGLMLSMPIRQGSDVAAAETLHVMSSQTMQHTFQVNAVGTFLLLRELAPHLRANHGKVIIMGSRMGSVGYNSVGGGYAYRASKAAMNATVKSLSIDEPEILFAIVHPGRVESKLVGEGVIEDGAITAEETVCDMLPLISRLQRNDSGRFMDRFGEDIVW